jgi:hypothetical protein
MSGAANPGCSRLSGGSAGPREFFWSEHETGLDWVAFDVTLNPAKLFSVSDEVIVAFILPEMASGQAENLIGLVTGEAFQRAEPFCGDDVRGDQHVDVVGHDHVGMENVSMEAALSFLYGFDYALGDFGDFQEERAGLSFVQDSVHRHKRLPGVQGIWWEDSTSREAAPEPKSHEEGLAYYVPVRQEAGVVLHQRYSASNTGKFSGDFATEEPAESRLQPGLAAPLCVNII